jgi:hypothetical protein
MMEPNQLHRRRFEGTGRTEPREYVSTPVTMLPYQVFQWVWSGPMNPFLRGGRKQVILAP